MKKFSVIIVLAVLVLSSLACGSSSKSSSEGVDPVAATVAAQEKTTPPQAEKVTKVQEVKSTESKKAAVYKVGETAEADKVEVVIDSVKEVTIENYQPESGKRFMRIDVTFKNIGDKDNMIGTGSFKLLGPDGSQIENDITAVVMAKDVKTLAESLMPGAKMSGGMIFQVPLDAKGFKLFYKPMLSFNDTKIEFDPDF